MTRTPTSLEKTADIYDEHEADIQVCEPIFRDFGGHVRFSGPICTIKCHEDNSLVRELLGNPGKGRVLVVDAGGSMRCAMLGDILAQKGVDNGWSGGTDVRLHSRRPGDLGDADRGQGTRHHPKEERKKKVPAKRHTGYLCPGHLPPWRLALCR